MTIMIFALSGYIVSLVVIWKIAEQLVGVDRPEESWPKFACVLIEAIAIELWLLFKRKLECDNQDDLRP